MSLTKFLICIVIAATLAYVIPIPSDTFFPRVPWCSARAAERAGSQLEFILKEQSQQEPEPAKAPGYVSTCIVSFRFECKKQLKLKRIVEKDRVRFVIFEQVNVGDAPLIVYLMDGKKLTSKFEYRGKLQSPDNSTLPPAG